MIHGLRLDSLVEKISLYADDTLLYLADSDISLQTALQTIEYFGSFSSLKINWDKSQILPIDNFPSPKLQEHLPLQKQVSSIKYLGVSVSRSPADYLKHRASFYSN